jgi:BMFP domain-containing protein YqiC
MDTSRISGLLGDVIGLLKAHDIDDNMLHEQISAVINSALIKADVVTRDEFEAQRAVLLRTRTKLEQLETLVADLEKQIKA